MAYMMAYLAVLRAQMAACGLVLGCLLLLSGAHTAQAAFAMNYQWATAGVGGVVTVDNSTPMGIDCGAGSTNSLCTMASYGSPDLGTRFMQQVVTGTDGKTYYHVVTGETSSGFAQEVFIEAGTQWTWQKDPSCCGLPDGGGFPSGYIANTFDPTNVKTCMAIAGDACRPLGTEDCILQGCGQENPTHVYMRQTVTDAKISMEFLQDVKGQKPLITQTLVDAGLTLDFKADMRGVNYSQMNSPLAISSNMAANNVYVNKMSLVDALLPSAGSANFDMATSTQAGKSRVNAGRFTWTAGVGWTECVTTNPCTSPYGTYYARYNLHGGSGDKKYGDYPIYQPGTYTYWEGNYDITKVKYLGGYLIPAQNPCGGDPFCADPAPAWPGVGSP